MMRFDGTAARQLDLIDFEDDAYAPPAPRPQRMIRPTLTLLKEDVYAAILRRRRRAQIAARHAMERER